MQIWWRQNSKRVAAVVVVKCGSKVLTHGGEYLSIGEMIDLLSYLLFLSHTHKKCVLHLHCVFSVYQMIKTSFESILIQGGQILIQGTVHSETPHHMHDRVLETQQYIHVIAAFVLAENELCRVLNI